MNKLESKISYYKLFWIFIIGSVFGVWYEEILILIVTGEYQRRSALVFGPFSIVYGLAAACSILFLSKVKKWNYLILYGAILGGSIEYFSSVIQEVFASSRSWDYSNLFLNINGRTTIPYALFWGILIFLFVKYGYPYLSNLIDSIPTRIAKPATFIFSLFLIFNLIFSATIMLRRTLRVSGVAAFTPIGEFFDVYYNDQEIKRLFPNLEFIDSTN